MTHAPASAPAPDPNDHALVAGSDEPYAPKAITVGGFDPTRVNNLIRSTSIVQTNPYLKPVMRQVLLDQPADTYPITQRKQGDDWVPAELGISAVGLANLANIAGVVDIPQASGRVDDGRDPGLVTYRSTAAMRAPDGEWQVKTRECTVKLSQLEKEIRAAKTKKGKENRNYRTKKPEPWSDERIEAEISKEMLLKEKFMERLAETGAKNRATRALLGLATKYTPADIAKPFVFMAVVPDMSHPELRARMLDQATTAIGGLFGPVSAQQQAPAPRLLSAGPSEADVAHSDIEGGDLTRDEIAAAGGGADEAVDGQFEEQSESADAPTDEQLPWATGSAAPDAKAAAAADFERWGHAHAPIVRSVTGGPAPCQVEGCGRPAGFDPAAGTLVHMEKPKAPVEEQLLADLRELGAQGEDPEALASADELKGLGEIFAGWDDGLIKAGLKAVWPDTLLQNLSGSQAQAIASVHERLGHDRFETTWAAMVRKGGQS
jgi:hypothetical protein